MNACTRDLPRRRDFLRALETQILRVGDNTWNEAIEKATPDKIYGHLQDCLVAACVQVFPRNKQKDPSVQALKDERQALLSERISVREQGGNTGFLTMQLTRVTRRLQRLARRFRRTFLRDQIDETWMAWRARRFHELHALRVTIAGNGRGPRKRHFWSAPTFRPLAGDIIEHLKKPGAEGGLSATPASFDDLVILHEIQAIERSHFNQSRYGEDELLPQRIQLGDRKIVKSARKDR